MNQVSPTRSRIMRSVRQRNTKPELIVRRALYAIGYRFRANLKGLPGSPDIAFTKRQKAIFVHGCFWHHHSGCRFATMPKTRRDFWQAKFTANIERDRRNRRQLEAKGWEVKTVWECETRDLECFLPQLKNFLGPPKYLELC